MRARVQATIYFYKRYLGFGLTLYIDIINIIPTEKPTRMNIKYIYI